MSRGGNRTYIRDGRAPVPKSEVTSRVMSANKAKDTKPELVLRQALRQVGIPGYRKHWKKAPGRPDVAYPSRKVAVFVHGCFWHRCPKCNFPLPKSNTEWWKSKFEKNRELDARKTKALEEDGWKVFVIWECEIGANPTECALRIRAYADGTPQT